jgi:hypothetical protein
MKLLSSSGDVIVGGYTTEIASSGLGTLPLIPVATGFRGTLHTSLQMPYLTRDYISINIGFRNLSILYYTLRGCRRLVGSKIEKE